MLQELNPVRVPGLLAAEKLFVALERLRLSELGLVSLQPPNCGS